MFRMTTAALVVVFALCGFAAADESKLSSSIALRQEYNSNVFFESNDEKDDFITRVKAGLEWVNRTERLEARLAGFLTPYFYWDETDLSSVDQDYEGRATWTLTPRLAIGTEAEIRVDHEPDRDIATTGLALNDNRRIRQRYGANSAWTASELDTYRAGYTYSREDFRASSEDTTEDWVGHLVDLGLTREFGAGRGMTQGLLDLGFGVYDYENSDTAYIFSTVGIRHRLSEVFTVSASGGPLYSDSDYKVRETTTVPPGVSDSTTKDKSKKSLGALARLGLEYAGERTDGNLAAFHEMDPSSGGSGVLTRTGFSLGGGYRIQERLRAGVYAAAFYNESQNEQFTGGKIDEYTYVIGPNLRWEFTRDLALDLGYQFIHVDNRTDNNESQRHTALVQLSYSITLFE